MKIEHVLSIEKLYSHSTIVVLSFSVTKQNDIQKIASDTFD